MPSSPRPESAGFRLFKPRPAFFVGCAVISRTLAQVVEARRPARPLLYSTDISERMHITAGIERRSLFAIPSRGARFWVLAKRGPRSLPGAGGSLREACSDWAAVPPTCHILYAEQGILPLGWESLLQSRGALLRGRGALLQGWGGLLQGWGALLPAR